MSTIETVLTIKSDQLDSVYHHLHHAQYFHIFEKGRTELLAQAGLPLEALIAQGYFPVVTKVEVTFQREVTAQSYRLVTTLREIRWRAMIFDQVLYDEAQKEVSLATVHCMVINKATGKTMSMPPEWKQKLHPSQD